jgi:hypothetical protein
MKRLSFVFFMALGASLFIVACKQGDKTNVQVPKDAALVLHLNNTSLSGKLSWDEIKATNWFKDAYADASDSLLRQLLDNPDNSGMDTKADMVFFVKKQGRGSYFAFGGTLKDAEAFEKFNIKVNKGGEAAHEGDAHVLQLKNNKSLVRWEGTRFVYISDASGFGAMPNFTPGGGVSYSEPYSYSMDSLKLFAKQTLEISGDNSIGDDKRYAELIKQNGDLHLWVNNEQYLSSLGGDLLGMMKISDLYRGNASATTINFDNGKIVMDSKQYLNDQLASLFKKYPPKKISADVINRIPSQNVVGVLALNYSPEGLKELIALTGLDGFANGFLQKANYSIEEFVKANKGDLIVSVSDFQLKKEEVTIPGYEGAEPYKYTRSTPDVKVLFAASINDKAAFDKLVNTLAAEIPKESAGMPDISYKSDGNWFVASNAADFVDKFIAGASTKQPFVNKLEGQSFGMFVDIQKILTGARTGMDSEDDKLAADASLKLWQDILVTGGGFNDKTANSHAEINFVDKSTNSLKQLNQYIDVMSGIKKRNRANVMNEDVAPVAADTTAIAPAN